MDLSLLSKYAGECHDEHLPVSDVQELVLLPLPNVVLIPGTVLPLSVVSLAHQQIVDRIVESGSDCVISFAPLGRDKEMMLSRTCGAGRLSVIDSYPDGRKNLVVEGDYRVELIEFVKEEPYMVAKVKWLPDLPYPQELQEIRHQEFVQLVRRWLFLLGSESIEYTAALDLFKAPHHLADFIAGYFLPDYTLKQKLLETQDCDLRVFIVEEILKKAIGWFGRKTSSPSSVAMRSSHVSESKGERQLH